MYLLKLALRPWRLAPLSQLFAAISVGFLLLLAGFLFWMQTGLKTVIHRLKGEQVITVYLQNNLSKEEPEKILSSVRKIYSSDIKNLEIKLVSSSQFIQAIRSQYPDLGRELDDLGPEVFQIVPQYISVSGYLPDASLEMTKDQIKAISGVETIENSKDRYHHVVGAFLALRWVARILLGGIGLALLTGLIHLSRMNSYLHRDALTLLRFWGASNSVLAGPGMFSGFFVGILGGGIAWAGWATLGVWFTQHVGSISVMLKGMPPVPPQLAIILFLLSGLVGMVSGIVGSLSASHLNPEGGLEA